MDRWEPVLAGALAERAWRTVEAIAAALPEVHARRGAGATLADGWAGTALLWAELERTRPEALPGEASSEDVLARAMEDVAARPYGPDLYEGFSGVSWAVARQEPEEGWAPDEDPLGEVDSALEAFLSRRPPSRDYDLIRGLVGIGVYVLERAPRPVALRCFEQILAQLTETMERRDGGLTWWTPPELLTLPQREAFPKGYYNLGMAHGVPGVMALLALAHARGVGARARVQELLEGATEWLVAQRLPSGERGLFSWVSAEHEPRRSTRCAWCYGEPGTALALLSAGRALGRPEWEALALEGARLAAVRPLEHTGVIDAGLCHGASGLGHVFNRLYQATGEPWLREAAVTWLTRALDMAVPGEGVGGYRAFEALPAQEPRWSALPGVLGGAAGVALALVAGATASRPRWDRMLLADCVDPRAWARQRA
jgi:lantibiotic modifying enzyme